MRWRSAGLAVLGLAVVSGALALYLVVRSREPREPDYFRTTDAAIDRRQRVPWEAGRASCGDQPVPAFVRHDLLPYDCWYLQYPDPGVEGLCEGWCARRRFLLGAGSEGGSGPAVLILDGRPYVERLLDLGPVASRLVSSSRLQIHHVGRNVICLVDDHRGLVAAVDQSSLEVLHRGFDCPAPVRREPGSGWMRPCRDLPLSVYLSMHHNRARTCWEVAAAPYWTTYVYSGVNSDGDGVLALVGTTQGVSVPGSGALSIRDVRQGRACINDSDGNLIEVALFPNPKRVDQSVVCDRP